MLYVRTHSALLFFEVEMSRSQSICMQWTKKEGNNLMAFAFDTTVRCVHSFLKRIHLLGILLKNLTHFKLVTPTATQNN